MAGPPPISKKKSSFSVPPKEPPPQKIVLNTVEGWGKTTSAAQTESPFIIMAPLETGYRTLYSFGRVPGVPSAVASSWTDFLRLRDEAASDSDCCTIALDALGGFEQACRDYVCKNEFFGNWDKFAAYGKGMERVSSEWLKTLASLEHSGKSVIMLAHSKVKSFSDPLAEDYDRYVVDAHHKVWGATMRWADLVLFGTFESLSKDGKGKGGYDRVVYTEHRDAYDAKNRHGLPHKISIPNDRTKTWPTIDNEIKKALNQ